MQKFIKQFCQYGVFILCTMTPLYSIASTLKVGIGFPYADLQQALEAVTPGDTILIHQGLYNGGVFGDHIQGTAAQWIYIYAAPGHSVIFEGGTNAWQFSDAAYIHIKDIIFQHQTGNGVNFDDGGSYDTPAHHVIFEHCQFRDMNASGNNDLLKLSGLDSFQIIDCLFFLGAEGGSGIDMVGCHDGIIMANHFEELGSNSIQAKGGTRNIRIERNKFKNGGERAVNLGGSTGLQFFRPLDAPYEAADLKVYSNIFMGSTAPIAYVGCINTEVINNTIYLPEKWVIRILQETVDPDRFFPCRDNTFRNNIVVIDDRVMVEVNIGPNTLPETFTLSNNLWFHSDDLNWAGPVLPVTDFNNIVGLDPLFTKAESESFSLLESSPAVGAGLDVVDPVYDFMEVEFLMPRSIGAYEGGIINSSEQAGHEPGLGFTIYPNPFSDEINVVFNEKINGTAQVTISGMNGNLIESFHALVLDGAISVSNKSLNTGAYLLSVKVGNLSIFRIVFRIAGR